MNDRDKKDIRKQLRNVAQELLPAVMLDVMSSALMKSVSETLDATLNQRIDMINTYCKTSLEEQDKRAKSIQGFLLREVKFNIANQLHNMEVTLLAWEELMQEKLGMPEDFNAALDEKKKQIQQKLEAEAVAAQQLAIKAKEANEMMETNEESKVS